MTGWVIPQNEGEAITYLLWPVVIPVLDNLSEDVDCDRGKLALDGVVDRLGPHLQWWSAHIQAAVHEMVAHEVVHQCPRCNGPAVVELPDKHTSTLDRAIRNLAIAKGGWIEELGHTYSLP
jgi:hypothetical protein